MTYDDVKPRSYLQGQVRSAYIAKIHMSSPYLYTAMLDLDYISQDFHMGYISQNCLHDQRIL